MQYKAKAWVYCNMQSGVLAGLTVNNKLIVYAIADEANKAKTLLEKRVKNESKYQIKELTYYFNFDTLLRSQTE